MTDITDALPSDPLERSLAEQFAARDGRFVPVVAITSGEDELVCGMRVEGAERMRGVGYDESADYWEIVCKRPAEGALEGLPEAQRVQFRNEIKQALESWADENYEQPTILDK